MKLKNWMKIIGVHLILMILANVLNGCWFNSDSILINILGSDYFITFYIILALSGIFHLSTIILDVVYLVKNQKPIALNIIKYVVITLLLFVLWAVNFFFTLLTCFGGGV